MLDLRLANPGSGRIGTNPEQLLAAGWSASFESALAIAARERGIALPADLNIETAVSLELADDGYFISVEFHIRLKDVDPKIAKTLVDQAHWICPFSKATRGNISVAMSVL